MMTPVVAEELWITSGEHGAEKDGVASGLSMRPHQVSTKGS